MKLRLALAAFLGAALAVHAERDMDALLQRATRYGNTAERRAEKEAARAELFAMGAEGLRGLMARAHLENLMLHVLAFEVVNERVPAERGIPVLAGFLASEHPRTRRVAAYLLGFYPRDEASIPALLALLDEEKQRNAALRTLGKWNVEAAAPRARALLRAEAERTRIAACNALAELRLADDLPVLMGALGDESLLVRNAAGRAILAHGRAAARPLRRALGDAAGVQRRQIARLLVALDALPARERNRLADDPGARADFESPDPASWF